MLANAGLSVLYWFLAACFIKYWLGDILEAGPMAHIGLLVASIAGIYLTMIATARLLNLRTGQMMESVAWLSWVAMCLDGLALVWMPQLYSPVRAVSQAGGAWLLFGAGAGLLISHFATAKTDDRHALLGTRQWLAYGIGLGFWLSGMLIIRAMGDNLLASIETIPLVYLITVGASVPAVLILKPLLKLRKGEYVRAVSIVTGAAISIDGLILSLAPTVYAPTGDAAFFATTFLLWFAGLGYPLAVWGDGKH